MNRFARSLLALVACLVLSLSLAGSSADAARGWCRMDPVIMIDGQLADVFVGSDAEMLLRAAGPIRMVITMPTGSTGSVVLMDAGFGYGYKISFVNSSRLKRTATHTQVKIQVYAPATKSTLPVEVTFAPRSTGSSLTDILIGRSASGYANRWVSLTTT